MLRRRSGSIEEEKYFTGEGEAVQPRKRGSSVVTQENSANCWREVLVSYSDINECRLHRGLVIQPMIGR
jgi:hypothetical protein